MLRCESCKMSEFCLCGYIFTVTWCGLIILSYSRAFLNFWVFVVGLVNFYYTWVWKHFCFLFIPDLLTAWWKRKEKIEQQIYQQIILNISAFLYCIYLNITCISLSVSHPLHLQKAFRKAGACHIHGWFLIYLVLNQNWSSCISLFGNEPVCSVNKGRQCNPYENLDVSFFTEKFGQQRVIRVCVCVCLCLCVFACMVPCFQICIM
jgi:hypothetical protein